MASVPVGIMALEPQPRGSIQGEPPISIRPGNLPPHQPEGSRKSRDKGPSDNSPGFQAGAAEQSRADAHAPDKQALSHCSRAPTSRAEGTGSTLETGTETKGGKMRQGGICFLGKEKP